MNENPIIINGVTCNVEKTRYTSKSKRIKLQLYDISDGMPYLTATVDLPKVNVTLSDALDYTFIKNYSENAGVLQALEKAGIIETTKLTMGYGHQRVNFVKVLI